MDAVTGPALQTLPEDAHLLVPVLDRAEREPDRPVAAHRVGPGFQWITAAEFATRVRKLAKGLVATGVAPGDRVALMSRTRLEWPLVDYAILMAGGVTVPIYDTSSAEQSWRGSSARDLGHNFEDGEEPGRTGRRDERRPGDGFRPYRRQGRPSEEWSIPHRGGLP